jgi:hypothetical protein
MPDLAGGYGKTDRLMPDLFGLKADLGYWRMFR